MKNIFKNINSFLCLPLKILSVIWFIYSLNALSVLNMFQWLIIFLLGSLIFIFLPQFLINFHKNAKRKKSWKQTMKSLFYYKNNYQTLDNVELSFYKNTLELMLDQAKISASIVNNTLDLKTFIEHWDNTIKILNALSEHEFTGFFTGNLPSNNLNTIIKNKYLTEIKFIKRAFEKNKAGGYIIPSRYSKYISFFSKQGINFLNTGVEPPCSKYEEFEYIPKNTVMSNEESDINLKGNVDKPENNFDSMSGHEFERFFASILEKNGFYNVEVTPGSGDHGIDVLAEKDDITYAFQCKCYSKDIGNSAVQQAHTGKSIYKTDIAVVITNREFTPQAKEEAEILGVKLWDRNKLIELINNQK